MEGPIKLTARDKILLLLLNYTRYRGEMHVPADLTQDGIANNLGIIRSAVPRAVGTLVSKGDAEEYLAHVDNMARRRKVYLLTDQGIMAARSLMDQLYSLEIELADDGKRKKASLGSLMAGGEVSLKNITEVVLSRKLDRSVPETGGTGRSKRTSKVHTLTPPDIFLDREVETEEISRFLSSTKKRILVIYGIAGVGKTTLCWKVAQVFGPKMDIFYIDLKEWTTLNYVVRELADFLASRGTDCISQLGDLRTDIDTDRICDLLKTLPQDPPMLMIFDDLHRAPKEVNDFLGCLKDRLPWMKGTHMLVLSRARATFYDVRDVRLKGLVGEMELLGFDLETSRKLLNERGFDAKDVDSIIDRTRGHPLALVLVEKEGLDIDLEDFDQFLEQEVFSKLSPEALRVLGLLSLTRLQLTDADLSFLVGNAHDALSSLMDHHLVFGSAGGYMVHDLIKEQAVKALKPDVKASWHRDLSKLFHERLEGTGFHQDLGLDVPPYPFAMEGESGLGPVPLLVSEEVFHQLGSGNDIEAMEVLIKAALQVPSKDLIREFGPQLLTSRRNDKDPRRRSMKDAIAMLMYINEGAYAKALAVLRKLSRAKVDKDPLTAAIRECLRLWIPYLTEKAYGPEDGLKEMDDIDSDSIPGRLRYYFLVTRASLMYKVGDHKGASKAYSEFLEAITANDELPLQLRETLNDAISKASRGSFKEATDQFQRIMALTSSNRDILKEEMPFVDVDHHLLSAIYSLHHTRS